MSPLKVIIPLFIVLGLLQAAVLALPFVYWRFAVYMGPINKFLFGSLLLFLAFIAHPLLIITLITFTIAPTLLSLRHNLTSRLTTAYCALVPSTLPAIPFLNDSDSNSKDKTADSFALPKTSREWLFTALSGFVGWKTLGTLPSLMILLVALALRKGREADGDRGWLAKGLMEGNKVEEKGVSTRSARTDIQVLG